MERTPVGAPRGRRHSDNQRLRLLDRRDDLVIVAGIDRLRNALADVDTREVGSADREWDDLGRFAYVWPELDHASGFAFDDGSDEVARLRLGRMTWRNIEPGRLGSH